MPQIAAITLLDGASTPVPHVFNPTATLPTAKFVRNSVAGQAVSAWEQLAVKVKLAQNSSMNFVDLELKIPVMEQATGGTGQGYVAPPRVAHTLTAKVSFMLDNRSDVTGRKDLRTLVANALKDPQIIACVDNLEQPY